ncbi:MAG: geranylgeranyl reductase family protein [Ilumatobacteraceae bacterium]|nr:geranylgeranyl reductase family protein [Ilumatobacteraceae bacterium]
MTDESTAATTLVTDVLVIGGGPAGAAAAIEVARGGREVTVIDKATFPRDKCCGDGLTTLALRELEHLGVTPAAVERWVDVDGAAIRSPSGREVFVPLPRRGRYAAVAPRLDLDAAVLTAAAHTGAKVIDGCALIDLEQRSDRVVATTSHGPIEARYVVAADGMWSRVRKVLGLGPERYLGEWHGIRQYVREVTGPAAKRLYVWFEPDLLPGYAWSFPLPDGRANVGFGVRRDGTHPTGQMGDLWRDLLQRPHVVDALGPDAELEDRHTAWPIPARIDEAVLADGRVLFTGDAAMATDVLTGEGIGQALLTGRLAAEAILAAGALAPNEATSQYSASVGHHLRADHKMSAALGDILAHERGARGAIRVVEASGNWGRQNFARWMFEDEPRAVLLTPSRWHRRLLARPGAYT